MVMAMDVMRRAAAVDESGGHIIGLHSPGPFFSGVCYITERGMDEDQQKDDSAAAHQPIGKRNQFLRKIAGKTVLIGVKPKCDANGEDESRKDKGERSLILGAGNLLFCRPNGMGVGAMVAVDMMR